MSSKIVEIPGRKLSASGKVTAWMRKVQIYTKPQIIQQFIALGKDEKKATYLAQMLLTPRLVSKHGNPEGSINNPWRLVAYNEPLAREAGKEWRFRFRFRTHPLVASPKVIKIASAKKTKVSETNTKPATEIKATETV